LFDRIEPVGHQTSTEDKRAERIDRRQTQPPGQFGEQFGFSRAGFASALTPQATIPRTSQDASVPMRACA
jgi:hypothetical protein